MLATALLAYLKDTGPIILIFTRMDLLKAWRNHFQDGVISNLGSLDARIEYLLPAALEDYEKTKGKGSRAVRGEAAFDVDVHDPNKWPELKNVTQATVVVDEADHLLYKEVYGPFFKPTNKFKRLLLQSATDRARPCLVGGVD